MILLRIFEIIFCIFMVVFATIFTIVEIGIMATKDAVNDMMNFKGDKKNE